MNVASTGRVLQWLLLISCSTAVTPARAGDHSCSLNPNSLAQMDSEALEALFRQGAATAAPIGYARGRTLLVVDAKNPQRRARLNNVLWKGKHFLSDGRMVNQWAVGRAVEATVRLDASWLDGQPCIYLDYPTNAPIFGNTRDEIREIAPGLYLGRFYDRCPCPRLKGYFVLQMECCSANSCAPAATDAPRPLP